MSRSLQIQGILLRTPLGHSAQDNTLHVIDLNVVKELREILEEIPVLGRCLKLGIHVDSFIRANLAELLELNTSKSENEQFSLQKYVGRMKVVLIGIRYLVGLCIAMLPSSPFLAFRARSVLRYFASMTQWTRLPFCS